MAEQPSDSPPNLNLQVNDIKAIVESEFPVLGAGLEFGALTFTIQTKTPPKEPFTRLVYKLKPYNLIPQLRRSGERLIIQVMPKPPTRPSRPVINLILFAVTVVTVFLSGYFNSTLWIRMFGGSQFIEAAIFTVALLAIVGLHEFGHKTAARISGVKATYPYFIPGPPFPIGFGTLGAVIMQREPLINRDQLFNLGFSGPAVGFLVTLVVSVFAIQNAQVVRLEAVSALVGGQVAFLNAPLMWDILVGLMRPVPEGLVHLTPPIGLAAWLGFVITFLNLLPVWQLDGGHITRAMFGERGQRVASALGILIAFATGFWFFGLIILFFMVNAPRHVSTLDDVSPISGYKKAVGVTAYLMLALSAVIIWG